MRLNIQTIQQQISNLLIQHPELAEDDILRADSIEGETEANDFLRLVEQRRQEAATLAGALASNITEMELRMGRFERRERAMRELMFKVMNTADLRKIELPEATLSIRNGTPKVIITNEQAIPDLLCHIKREPDKKRIKELLTGGNLVQGAELSNAEQTLSIRTR